MRTPRRVRAIRVLCLTVIALFSGAALAQWHFLAAIPVLIAFRLSLKWALDEQTCPTCEGGGVTWRGPGRQHLVCARCGGFGVVDRFDGRRAYARDGNMRGRL